MFHFQISLRFEIFYALQTLLDRESRIHHDWIKQAKQNLPNSFFNNIHEHGLTSNLWVAIADALECVPLDISFKALKKEFQSIDDYRFQYQIFEGLLHHKEIVQRLLVNTISLPEAISYLPKKKQEWLTFMGLFPYVESSPIAQALNHLHQSPRSFIEKCLHVLDEFWSKVFLQTWNNLQIPLQQSIEVKNRLFASLNLKEFMQQALIRVEVDEEEEWIKAVRGGFTLPIQNIETAYFIPSVFNDKRYWTSYEQTSGKQMVYFPYFEPAISILPQEIESLSEVKKPAPDIFLVFKALGDPTRFGIMKLIAKKPLASAEIARQLSLSRATVSHHVHLLRDAGLIEEKLHSGSILLSPNETLLKKLSSLALYGLGIKSP